MAPPSTNHRLAGHRPAVSRRTFVGSAAATAAAAALSAPPVIAAHVKKRIFVVSSYHREYLWSISTQNGLGQAMLDYGYLDSREQADALAANDQVKSGKSEVRKAWMDTKRRTDQRAIAGVTDRIMRQIETFEPDLVMLGDDNAAKYIGNQLLDTETPVVFWGINGLPLKYGLVESMDSPGHNITGVWQSGYHKEALDFLHALKPEAESFAILACDSVTSRPNVKQLKSLAARGELPLDLQATVVTNSLAEFREMALSLSQKVDAFFVLNHDTLYDDNGEHVDMMSVGRWYLENILKPEASHEDQFVREGLLLTANDSGFNQSYRAFEMAYDILEQGLNPARMRTVTPQRGPLMINSIRARQLGVSLEEHKDIIEVVVDEALALA